jgi:hypothetical protein
MALRDKLDETKLRSLTYGDNTPYVTVDVNTQKVTSNGKELNVSNNGTIINSAIIDTSRITAAIKDKPWWAAQQIAIQAMNSRANFGFVEGRIKPTFTSDQQYTPLNTLAQVALNGVGGHIERKGLVPGNVTSNLLGTGTYEAVKKRENDLEDANVNPLVTFYKDLKLTEFSYIEPSLQPGNFLSNAISLFKDPNKPIYSYAGGPNSLFGVGTTTIRRYYNSIESIRNSKLRGFEIKPIPDVPEIDVINLLSDPSFYAGAFSNGTLTPNEVFNSAVANSNFKDYSNDQFTTYQPTKNPLFNIYTTASGVDGTGRNYNVNQTTLITTNDAITYDNGFTTMSFKSPGKGWYGISREVRVGSGKEDQINLTPLFTTNNNNVNDRVKIGSSYFNIKDLVNFRIEAIQTDSLNSTWMVFRSFLTDLSDQTTATWNGFKYIGRGENFYTYQGHERTISVSFKVAAISEEEMKPMYQKLNYLMSNMMGDYKEGIMRGPMTKMTIGNYINRQPGIITSLTYKVTNDSPWEIVLDTDNMSKGFITDSAIPNEDSNFEPWSLENPSIENLDKDTKQLVLPHVIEVTLSFTPIGAQTDGENKLPQRTADQSNIAQVNNTYAKPEKDEIEPVESKRYNPPKIDPLPPTKTDPIPPKKVPKYDPPKPPKKKVVTDPPKVVKNDPPKYPPLTKHPDFYAPDRDHTKAVVGARSPNFTAKVGSTYTLDGKQYVFGGRYKTRGFDPLARSFYGGGSDGGVTIDFGNRPGTNSPYYRP